MAHPEGKVIYHLSPSFLSVKWENTDLPPRAKPVFVALTAPGLGTGLVQIWPQQ